MPLTTLATVAPMMDNVVVCKSPSTPMPSNLPASNCRVDTVASTTSTTRDDFSSNTPCSTAAPKVDSAKKSSIWARLANPTALGSVRSGLSSVSCNGFTGASTAFVWAADNPVATTRRVRTVLW